MILAPGQNRVKAALFAVSAVGFASMQDAAVKGVSAAMPASEAVLFRAVVALPLLFIWLWLSERRINLITHNVGLVLLRGLIMCMAYFSFVLSIAALPIATSVSIYFTMPFFVAALAGWTLGENVAAYRWIAIAAGFAGVLLMVRPGVETFEPAALLALLSAAAYAVGQLLSRHVSQSVPPLVVATWQSIVYGAVAVVLSLIAPIFMEFAGDSKVLGFLLRPWVWPDGLQLLMLTSMGVFATFGSVLFVYAYRMADANYVAPFEYTALLWAIVFGIVFFGDVPDAYTMMGAGIVVAAGLWMLRMDFAQRQH